MGRQWPPAPMGRPGLRRRQQERGLTKEESKGAVTRRRVGDALLDRNKSPITLYRGTISSTNPSPTCYTTETCGKENGASRIEGSNSQSCVTRYLGTWATCKRVAKAQPRKAMHHKHRTASGNFGIMRLATTAPYPLLMGMLWLRGVNMPTNQCLGPRKSDALPFQQRLRRRLKWCGEPLLMGQGRA